MVKSKNQDFSPNSRNKKAGTGFLTPKARLVFTQLKKAFEKAPILHHFNAKSHIQIETDAFSYNIGSILSQLFFGTKPNEIVTKIDLGQ